MWRVESSVRVDPPSCVCENGGHCKFWTAERESAHRVYESGSAREFSIADRKLAHRLADLLNDDDARRAAERDAS